MGSMPAAPERPLCARGPAGTATAGVPPVRAAPRRSDRRTLRSPCFRQDPRRLSPRMRGTADPAASALPSWHSTTLLLLPTYEHAFHLYHKKISPHGDVLDAFRHEVPDVVV